MPDTRQTITMLFTLLVIALLLTSQYCLAKQPVINVRFTSLNLRQPEVYKSTYIVKLKPIPSLYIQALSYASKGDRFQAFKLLEKSLEKRIAQIKPLIEALGGVVLNKFVVAHAILVHMEPVGLQRLLETGIVEYIEPNFVIRLDEPSKPLVVDNPSLLAKPLVVEEFGIRVTWGVARVDAPRVWGIGFNGSSIVVAVIDTGIDPQHPDLKGKLLTIEPGNPYYPGGWIEFDPYGNPVRSKPYDPHGHGTHVSGIIAGGCASGVCIGVAPGVKLRVAKAFDAEGRATIAQILAAMDWVAYPYYLTEDGRRIAVDTPTDVVNMSFGCSYYSEVLADAVRTLWELGIVPVAAIGNYGGGLSGSPGNARYAIAVGAINVLDVVAYFSSGEVVDTWFSQSKTPYIKPDFAAPGVEILSSLPGGKYAIWSGTSMATPHVAGVIALVIDALRHAGISYSVDDIYQYLKASVDDLGAPGMDTDYGYGVPNATRAVEIALNNRKLEVCIYDSITNEPLKAYVRVGPGLGKYNVFDEIVEGCKVLTLAASKEYKLEVRALGYETKTVIAEPGVERLTVRLARLRPISTLEVNVKTWDDKVAIAEILVRPWSRTWPKTLYHVYTLINPLKAMAPSLTSVEIPVYIPGFYEVIVRAKGYGGSVKLVEVPGGEVVHVDMLLYPRFRIVVVDDDPIPLAAYYTPFSGQFVGKVSKLLIDLGYDVKVTFDLNEVYRLAKSHEIDLVVMAGDMLVLNFGIDAVASLAKDLLNYGVNLWVAGLDAYAVSTGLGIIEPKDFMFVKLYAVTEHYGRPPEPPIVALLEPTVNLKPFGLERGKRIPWLQVVGVTCLPLVTRISPLAESRALILAKGSLKLHTKLHTSNITETIELIQVNVGASKLIIAPSVGSMWISCSLSPDSAWSIWGDVVEFLTLTSSATKPLKAILSKTVTHVGETIKVFVEGALSRPIIISYRLGIEKPCINTSLCTLRIPETPRGVYTLYILDPSTGNMGVSYLRVAPSLVVPEKLLRGSDAAIVGYAFLPGEHVKLILGSVVAEAVANRNGTVMLQAYIPVTVTPGVHTLTAVGSMGTQVYKDVRVYAYTSLDVVTSRFIVVGDTVDIPVLTLLEGKPVDAELSVEFSGPIRPEVLRLSTGVYLVRLRLAGLEPGCYTVTIKAKYETRFLTAEGYEVILLKLDASNIQVIGLLHKLGRNITKGIDDVKHMIEEESSTIVAKLDEVKSEIISNTTSKIEALLNGLRATLEESITRTVKMLNKTVTRLEARVEDVISERFVALEKLVETLGRNLTSYTTLIETRLESLTEMIESQGEKLNKSLSRLGSKVERISALLSEFEEANLGKLSSIESRLVDVVGALTLLRFKISGLERSVQALSLKLDDVIAGINVGFPTVKQLVILAMVPACIAAGLSAGLYYTTRRK